MKRKKETDQWHREKLHTRCFCDAEQSSRLNVSNMSPLMQGRNEPCSPSS